MAAVVPTTSKKKLKKLEKAIKQLKLDIIELQEENEMLKKNYSIIAINEERVKVLENYHGKFNCG